MKTIKEVNNIVSLDAVTHEIQKDEVMYYFFSKSSLLNVITFDNGEIGRLRSHITFFMRAIYYSVWM